MNSLKKMKTKPKSIQTLSASQTELPDKIIQEFQHLVILLKAIKGHSLVFALYQTVAEREYLVDQLKSAMGSPFQEIFLLKMKRKNVIDILLTESAKVPKTTRTIFIYDMEETFPESLNNLNLQREALTEIPRILVFWIREFALREIAVQAPDFWAWRSEVFDFRLTQPELAQPLAKQLVESKFFHQTHEDLERRISLYKELLAQLRTAETPDKKYLGYLLNQLGLMHDYLGEYDLAFTYYEESLKICQEIGDKSGEGTTLNNISGIYRARGDYAPALGYLERSLKIRQEIGDKSGEGTTLNNISQIYQARGDYAPALAYLERSLKISQEIGNIAGEAITGYNIARIYEEQGKISEAITLLARTVAIDEKIGHPNLESDREYLNKLKRQLK